MEWELINIIIIHIYLNLWRHGQSDRERHKTKKKRKEEAYPESIHDEHVNCNIGDSVTVVYEQDSDSEKKQNHSDKM